MFRFGPLSTKTDGKLAKIGIPPHFEHKSSIPGRYSDAGRAGQPHLTLRTGDQPKMSSPVAEYNENPVN
jgi:hypothetical protein